MNKRYLAIALSALACPGMGQWVLGEKSKGALMAGLFSVGLVVLTVRVFLVVYQFMLDPDVIYKIGAADFYSTIHHAVYAAVWPLLLPLGAVWLWSLIDVMRAGRAPAGGA